MTIIQEMLTEPTAHSLIDSGSIYGRAYEANQKRDFASEPQAKLKISKWGCEVTVSTYHHLNACLERDAVCEAFDGLDDGGPWNADYYGITSTQQEFLDAIGAEVDDGWNTYNWENNFDQTLQGHRVEINGEEYTLLQIHGGCDVRSGYTGARLFKLGTWMNDYWCLSDSSFCIPRDLLEAIGYPKIEGEYDYVSVDFRDGSSKPEFYDPNREDEVEADIDLNDLPEGFEVEGVQNAVEH